MKKFTLNLKTGLFIVVCLVFTAFSAFIPFDEQLVYIQQKLIDHYDSAQESKEVKRYELNVTNNGFCRYKRYFNNGKVEYFSFRLAKFSGMDYYGTDKNGKLYLRTKGEDVIVQTHNDPKGDVDSMANYMSIPLKDMEPEDLTDLSERLTKINSQVLVQK